MNWLIAALVSLAILGMWLITRHIQKSWISPGGILCATWFMGSAAPLVFSPDFEIHPHAYVVTLLFVTAGSLGTSLAMLLLRGERPPGSPLSQPDYRILLRVYLVVLALACVAPMVLYLKARNEFGGVDFLVLVGSVTDARYRGNFEKGLLVTVLNIFLYLAALLGGFLGGSTRKKKRRGSSALSQNSGTSSASGHMRTVFLLWAVPLFASALIQTTRAALAYGGILYLSGMIAAMELRGTDRHVHIGRLMGTLCGLCIAMVLVVSLGQMARWGSFDLSRASESTENAREALTGHMTVFGTWLEEGGAGRPGFGTGLMTFAGIADLLGTAQRERGIYNDSLAIQDTLTSNIFTAWRTLIDDFSLSGALLFMVWIGLAGGYGWVLLLRGRILGAPLLTAFLAFVLWSPVTSIYVYNTLLGAMVLFAFIIVAMSVSVRTPERAARIAAA